MSIETMTVTILEESEKAYKVMFNAEYAWIPKSQIEKMDRTGDKAVITIPYWLYSKHWD